MTRWTFALAAVALLATLAAAVGAAGAWRWARRTDALNARLAAAARPATAPPHQRAELAGLPAPVRRYFERVLPEGTPRITGVALAHRGEFNLAESGPARWQPFGSTQQVSTSPPGFVWDGRVRLLPGLAVHVHDAYIAGEGLLQPALAGWLTLATLPRSRALDEGELLRWLAEAPWYPTALLPGAGVTWQAIDARQARLVLDDGPLRVALTVGFSDEGFIERVQAAARGRSVQGRIEPTAWEGRWSGYAPRGGVWVPTRGEVAWLLPEGRLPYWRGELTAATYRFAP